MEAINKVTSKGPSPAPKSCKSSTPSQEDAALRKLLAKDPVLGEVMTILFGKLDDTNKRLDDTNKRLDDTNKRLDDLQGERQREMDSSQDQLTESLDAEVKVREVKFTEGGRATILGTIPIHKAEQKPSGIVLGMGTEAAEDCLGLPKILRRIMEQLSNKELINLSRVNKLWNFEARSVLRDRGSLMARIHTRPACLGLVQFASDLQQMRVVPFAGISLEIHHFVDEIDICESLSSESLNPSYQVILDRLPWKHLSVNFDGQLPELKDCPAFILVKRILEDYCWVLEELSFSYSRRQLVEFFQSIFEHRSFSFLKILKFAGPNLRFEEESPYTPAFVKTLVSSAPSLEKLCLDGPMKFQENVMEGSSAVLVATSGLRPFKDQFCESLIDAIRTAFIDVFRDGYWGFDVELLNKHIPMVIRASHTALKILWMDFRFAVPLMCYGICLENVTKLTIYMNDTIVGATKPDILALVKGFDFTRVFPKLDKVTIRGHDHFYSSSDDKSAFVEKGDAVARNALPDRAINIRHLELHYNEKKSAPPLIFLSQMFPHVRILSVKTYCLHEFPFALFWEHFGCLEELHIDFNGYAATKTINLDSAFCGIFPEEVAELREKDDDYLKAVNIVPVMPSITCTRGLRLFTLRYECWSAARKDRTRMFSKVTGLIGFPRCPVLSVKLQTTYNSPKALDHMKPYVTVVTEDCEL